MVPNLRFNDKQYQWYILNEFVTRVSRKNVNNISILPLTISAQYGLVDQISFFNKTVASKDMSGYYLLKNGEFAYNKSYSKDYPWGAIKRLDLYDMGCLSTLYICFKCNKSIVDSNYLVHYFESTKWHRQVSNIAGEGARNHGLLNIAVNDFFNTKHAIPPIENQKKIAKFLDLIEEKIQTQIKIINDYYSLKKAIIQRIFNASAQYSKVHLDIILKEISKKNKEQIHNNVLSVSNSLGFVKQSEQFVDREIASSDTSNYKIVNKNEYAYNPARINVGSIARLTNYDCGIVSPMYTVFEINMTRIIYEYFDYFLHSFTFQKQLNQRLEGSVRQCLTFNSMKNIEIELPPIEVQIEISKNMKHLDSKIKIESDYLNLLKSQKNYLLKNMFI